MKGKVYSRLLFVLIFFVSNFIYGAIPAQERAALIALYNSTNGNSWTNNGGWKTPPLDIDGFAMPGMEGSWHGITVASDQVTQINLASNQMSGEIPADMVNLTAITALDIGNNCLSATDSALRIWLDTHDPDWESTQTNCVGTISGRVTDGDGNGILNVRARLYNTANQQVMSVLTDSNGNYMLTQILPGDYKVRFDTINAVGSFVSIYYNEKAAIAYADIVTVTAGQTTTIDATLQPGGTISGRVTDTDGNGIANVRVLVKFAYSNVQYLVIYTDSGGYYTARGLPENVYKLFFNTDNTGNSYIPRWYNDKEDFLTADIISIAPGQTVSDANTVLAAGGTVSGRITDESTGNPIPDIEIYALDLNKNGVGCYTYTDENGDYAMKGLPTGNIKINFNSYYHNEYYIANYNDQWYNDKTTFPSADVLAVTAGQTISGLNAALTANGGIVKGRVTNESGQGVANVYVWVITEWAEFSGWEAFTDTDGYYQVTGIPTGEYHVIFLTNTAQGNYLDEVFNNKFINGTPKIEADWVNVTEGQVTDNIDAVLSVGGYVSGRVTDTDGNPIQYIRVRLYDAVTGSYFARHNALTDFYGNYTVNRVRPGQLKACFSSYEAAGGNYKAEFYNDKTTLGSGDSFTVTSGQTTTGIDSVLSTGGGILSGYARDKNGGALKNASLVLYDTNGDQSVLGQVQSSSSGYFEFKGVIPGDYKLYISCNNYITEEWHNNKSSHSTADVITIVEGQNTQVEIVLGDDTSLTVTSPNGGEVWAGATVHPITWSNTGPVGNVKIEYSTNNGGNWTEIVSSTPNTGSYDWTVPPLSSLNCLVRISETDGSPTDVSDTIFTILADGTGAISGLVTDESGNPIQNVNVQAYNMNNLLIRSSNTNPGGNYTIVGLPAGNFKIFFRTINASGSYLMEWYNNKETYAEGDFVLVSPGQVTGAINAVLSPAGNISGRVTGADGNPIQNVQVNARNMNNVRISWRNTDINGNYTIQGLPVGSYKLFFNTITASGSYISEWHNDKVDFNTADPLMVNVGQTTSGIDAVLALGGSISGRVTDESTGNPLPDIEVDAYDLNGNYAGSYGYTDENGNYLINGLPNGDYKINFFTSDYNSGYGANYKIEYYNDKETYYIADSVPVTVGQITQGIDAALSSNGGAISGRVTDNQGNGIANVLVQSFVTEWASVSWDNYAYTDIDGNYRLSGLNAGSYIVGFFPSNRGLPYVPELYNDVHNERDATHVIVAPGQTTANIDATLDTAGTISGRVTDSNGFGLKGVRVRVMSASTKEYYSSENTLTDANGYYTYANAHPGQDLVFFAANEMDSDNYMSQFYNGKNFIDTANAVDVQPGGVYPNIDAALSTGGGRLAIYVKDVNNQPLAGVQFNLYHSQYPNALFYYNPANLTDNNGYYEFKGLIPGNYKLYTTYKCIVPSEWHQDKSTHQSADVITITEGQVTQISIILGDSGTINVTSPNGGEMWMFGSTHTITWDKTGNPANVKIEYSTNGGSDWATIVESAANKGSYSWTLPSVPSSNYLVRVSEIDGSPSDVGDAVFSVYSNPAGWVPVEGAQYNMIVYGKAWKGNNPAPAGDWVGAFGPGGLSDCKGVSVVDSNGNYYITIRSDVTAGETISFKLWPLPSGPSIDGSETIPFISDELYAGLPLHFGARTHVVPLVAGWNWVSFDALPSNTSFSSVFTGLIGVIEQVKTQTHAAIYSNGVWGGDLTGMNDIANGAMYKIKATQGCSVNINGMTVPFNMPLTLVTGWNWAAYLPTLPQSVETALNSIITYLQQVKSQTQSAVKIGNGLIGDLTQMEPNKGYTIKTTAPGMLVYPQGESAYPIIQVEETNTVPWIPIKGNQYNMVAFGKVFIEGLAVNTTGYYLAGVGPAGEGDCRFVSSIGTDGSYFSTILGNSNAETIKFKLYNNVNGKTYDIVESLAFQSDDLKADYALKARSIKVTAPAGGESFNMGSVCVVTWNSYNVTNVKIELIKGGRSVNTIASSVVAALQTYSWTIPTRLDAGVNYQIKISAIDAGVIAKDTSNSFAIIPISAITLNSPIGGEQWQVGRSYDITWGSSGINNIKIELYKGAVVNTVISSSTPAGPGKLAWAVPLNQALGVDYKIKVSSVDVGITAADTGKNNFSIVAQKGVYGDFNGDGKADILWRYYGTGGFDCLWLTGTLQPGPTVDDPRLDPQAVVIPADANIDNKIVGTGDFNSDGKEDILWRNTTTGVNAVWFMNGATYVSSSALPSETNLSWDICGTGDFNNDGNVDILLRNRTNGNNKVWLMNGITRTSEVTLTSDADTTWSIGGAGDFDNDGKADIVWRNTTTGSNRIWLMNGTTLVRTEALSSVNSDWEIVGAGDYNGNGKPDIYWRNKADGRNSVWLMEGLSRSSAETLTRITNNDWKIEN